MAQDHHAAVKLTGVPPPGGERWVAVDPADVEWREWASEVLVHLHSSGHTHLLPDPTGTIFLTLLQFSEGLTLDMLFARVFAGHEGAGASPEECASLQGLVEALRVLGLARVLP